MPSRVQAISHRRRRWRPQRSPQNLCLPRSSSLLLSPDRIVGQRLLFNKLLAAHCPASPLRTGPGHSAAPPASRSWQTEKTKPKCAWYRPQQDSTSRKARSCHANALVSAWTPIKSNSKIAPLLSGSKKTRSLAPKVLKRKQPDEPLGNFELPTSTIQKIDR